VRVDTAVLPYLHPVERLLIAAMQPLTVPRWYYMFLASPGVFLASLGVRNIYFLGEGGGEGYPPEERGPPELPPDLQKIPPGELESELRWIKASEIREIHSSDENTKHELHKTWGAKMDFLRADGYTIFSHHHPATHQYIEHLTLTFFVKSLDLEHLKKFYDCLKEKGLVEVDLDQLRTRDIVDILTDDKKIKLLRDCYRKYVSSDLNLTSLSLGLTTAWFLKKGFCDFFLLQYKTPVIRRTRIAEAEVPLYILIKEGISAHSFYLKKRKCLPFGKTSKSVLPFYLLLTGDTRLDLSDIRTAFMTRYDVLIKKLPKRNNVLPLIFQAPHHGSLRGFNWTTATEFTNKWGKFLASIVSCKWPRRAHAFNLLTHVSTELMVCHQTSPPAVIHIKLYGR